MRLTNYCRSGAPCFSLSLKKMNAGVNCSWVESRRWGSVSTYRPHQRAHPPEWGGGVGQRRHSCPAPTPPQLHSPDPRRPHLGGGVNIHLKNCFLNQVARCVLCSGKKIVKKRYEEGHCVLHSSLRKEVHRGTLREAPSMPEYISPPVPALAAGGPSRCQGHGPLHF